MENPMLQPALQFHNEGLCVIPCKERDKKPVIEWGIYHTQRSTVNEIKQWWHNGHTYNIGIVHGEVSGNYTTIDLDDDHGITDLLWQHPVSYTHLTLPTNREV